MLDSCSFYLEEKHMMNQTLRRNALMPLAVAIENDAIPKGKIWGFDGEAGLGKTTTMIEALFNLFNNKPNIKVLIVTPFVVGNTKGPHISGLINSRFGYNIAFAVDSNNVKSAGIQITSAPILVITHERLKNLLRDEKEGKRYFQGRDLIIIDEMPQFIEIIKITESSLHDLELIIPKSVLNKLQLVIGPIRDALSNSRYDTTSFELVPHPEMDILIADIIKVIESSYKDYIKSLNVKKHLKIKESQLISQVDALREFFNKPIIPSSDQFGIKAITTYDSSIDYKKLDKAIMMSADLAIYNSDQWKLFETSKTDRVADFSNWMLHFCPGLTGTSTSIEKYSNFYDEASDLIIRNIAHGDKVVIAGNKEQFTKTKELLKKRIPAGIDVEYLDFYNMVGTNDYSDFNKMFVLSVPIKPAYSYVHAYQYFENERLERVIRPMWMIRSGYLNQYYAGIGKQRPYLKPIVVPMFQQNQTAGLDVKPFRNSSHGYNVLELKQDAFDIKEKIKVGMQKKGKRMSMIAPEIEACRKADQFALLYQLIMRIDRQKLLNTEVFMLFSPDCFREDFKKFLKNVSMVDDIALNLIRSKQYNNQQRIVQSLANKFVDYLENLPSGEYLKSDIRKHLCINNSSQFSRMLNSDLVKEYIGRHDIKITKYKIIIK